MDSLFYFKAAFEALTFVQISKGLTILFRRRRASDLCCRIFQGIANAIIKRHSNKRFSRFPSFQLSFY